MKTSYPERTFLLDVLSDCDFSNRLEIFFDYLNELCTSAAPFPPKLLEGTFPQSAIIEGLGVMAGTQQYPEQTPRIWKRVQAVGAAIALGGAGYLGRDLIVGWFAVGVGTSVFVVGRAIAWWRYG